MNKLLSILLVSCMFAGELEVEGDLNVTGNISSQTIDSLLQVIADLQSQIALLGGSGNSEISAKIVEIPVNIINNAVDHTLLINEIIGELDLFNCIKLTFTLSSWDILLVINGGHYI